MNKKRSRQTDAKGELIDGSTDSCDESNTTGSTCPHITKAVNFNKIKKYINKMGIDIECSTCKKSRSNSLKINEEDCTVSPAALICLQCGYQACGKEESGHALEHYKKPHSDCHFIAVDILHWNVWCFQCETKLHVGCRKKLQETVEFIKRSATVIRNSSPSNMILYQCQKEAVDTDVQKEKVISNLPKVGGLMNLGNTCFFNAVLQCLAQTPFLVKVLNDLRLPGQKFILPGGKHKLANSSEEVELPPIEGTLEGWGNFTSVLYETLVEMQNSDGRQSYRPSELLNSFKKKTIQCMDGGQHDSHELLRHLLELVRNEDLRRYQSIILKEVGLTEKTNPEGVEKTLKSRVKFYGNQASARLLGPELVFRGVLVSTLECLDCHHTSQSTEPFLDLSLSVMIDKPQPPVLKRKNSGYDDPFDTMEKYVSSTPSKYQLKKEKKAARKNRKNKKQEIHGHIESASNRSNIIEEHNGNILESEESDADIEDNVEAEVLLPEIGESGYSSEKQSTLTSPASPSIDPVKVDDTMNEITLNNCVQFSRVDNLSPILLQDVLNTKSLHSPNLIDASITNVSKTKDLDRLDSSESPKNKVELQTEFPVTTSSVVSSDVTSLGEPTVSYSALTLIECPGSTVPALKAIDNLEQIERPISTLNLIESITNNEQEEATWNQRKGRRKTIEHSNEIYNGINGISLGISKMGLGNSQLSHTRYATKEGECSIQSCLNQFTALELMSGSNKVSCEACTAREIKVRENYKMICTPSTKQYLISSVPAVLILHLKRFQAQRVDFRKVTRHVSFPIVLDLAPICKNPKNRRMYALYGVVEHSGTIHGGHYVAYVKLQVRNERAA
ncbi:ubiquitin carboxyl-terminal hydrolase 45 isoform X1 [Hylaeus anthracinus]|uniref:ubiquitin carboxyl-terminal hydrolase 45 isoform X1 n=2 Tax=Hylaeus anthracinus TaxID=313031 RepID=UPI0023B8A207|nr:ubiquitin carboxyl-terminal hydrolase 45 isoform X1 [Hylaeus anthracinus]XP_054002599.1 ubiquitin carboxyl-terminal hydrolase 45 isoform X1 [Hylaeus anthracinus]XP_054002600.1 ubiquitin carboxyl-terminal hydrolase 45 isoform X1 [Hylaeus anthracinus]XP_054002601.1 ubiquitin carboxyl-terminal hydrolase 45 isoform X1 [Hylaeus anthracinus]